MRRFSRLPSCIEIASFHFLGKAWFDRRRLDYFFVSNVLQECVKKADILVSFVTDHSPILFSLNQMSKGSHGKSLWKFYRSLLFNKVYVEKDKGTYFVNN